MSETERKLRDQLDTMLEISKRESAMLKAIESLGKVIEGLEMDVRLKTMRIEELEKKLRERSEDSVNQN